MQYIAEFNEHTFVVNTDVEYPAVFTIGTMNDDRHITVFESVDTVTKKKEYFVRGPKDQRPEEMQMWADAVNVAVALARGGIPGDDGHPVTDTDI